ncbi:hypothetical protein FBUS_08893 [Fasciolopsis buskii]|uniref:Uncharacterized protein n=1 Tax=Fasciolopsis buskii TaxID=27845 RepID=A0A8E0S026_9TREM|nr:hypothetical protein FBUS_08893 [Fasciolopsis buski]
MHDFYFTVTADAKPQITGYFLIELPLFLWIPYMVLYYVILLATAIAIGLLVGIRRDVSYSENDLATIERASKASKLTSWTPLRNLPAAPPAPPNLFNHIYLHEELFRPETFQQLKDTIMMYENFSNLADLWRYFWLSNVSHNPSSN